MFPCTYCHTLYDDKDLIKTVLDNYIFIIGSFAYTAPNLRCTTSDIDVLSNLSEEGVRQIVLEKYPHLPKDVPIDLTNKKVNDDTITFKIAYWQEPRYLSLIPTTIKLCFIKTECDVTNALRHPDKNEFTTYVATSPKIELHDLNALLKSISHYGEEAFWTVVNASEHKEFFLEMYTRAKEGQKGPMIKYV
jgi:hypothetical protein